MEPAQDRRVVVLVVAFLGLQAIGGMAALVFLIWSGTDATALLAITSAQNLAAGALAGILASTRSNPPVPIQQAQAIGYQQAVADVKSLTDPPPAPTPAPTPIAPAAAPDLGAGVEFPPSFEPVAA